MHDIELVSGVTARSRAYVGQTAKGNHWARPIAAKRSAKATRAILGHTDFQIPRSLLFSMIQILGCSITRVKNDS